MERTAVWKWRELKRGEEEINEIIGRAGGQGGELGPPLPPARESLWTMRTATRARTHAVTVQRYVQRTRATQRSRCRLVQTCTCRAAAPFAGVARSHWPVLVLVVQGVMAINCTVLSLLLGPDRGWCAGKVPLEVICCRVSDGLEMGWEREFTPPITGRS